MSNFSSQARITHCPLCTSSAVQSYYTITMHTPLFSVDRCNACNFMFMNPQPAQNKLDSYYSEDYYRGNAAYTYHDEREKLHSHNHVWRARLRNIHKFCKQGNFLDIGAAFGGFMQAAEQYYTAYGIEVSPYAGAYTKKHFHDRLHIGTLDSHPFPKNFFSVITMIEVLEHLTNPLAVLRQCADLLTNNGILVVQTANMDGWQAKKSREMYHYFLPGHVSYFTARNLTNALLETGFSRVKIYRPVDFGLIPKLLKSRGNFSTLKDYTQWFHISLYHLKGKLSWKGFPLTSSMVLYAFK